MTLPTPALSKRGTAGYDFAELFLALGPQAIGVAGSGELVDLIGRVWALVLTRDGRQLELYQRAADAATWERVTELLPPLFGEAQPEGRRRFSIAFDQSARATVAYEEEGLVYLTRWDASIGAYVQNVTIAGADPVVALDATWSYGILDSDVLLFYLSADRTRLLVRIQRQLYSIETELAVFDAPRVLDRIGRLPLRYQALLSDEAGEPIEVDAVRSALVSDLYPYPERDRLAASGEVYGAIGHLSETYQDLEEQNIDVQAEVYGAIGHSGILSTYVDLVDELVVSGEVYGLISHNAILETYVDGPDELAVSGDVSGLIDHVLTLFITTDGPDFVDVSAEVSGAMTHKEA